ncbi:hypothetical protein F5878DRAFT_699911, partial [Lentinula raphanica]
PSDTLILLKLSLNPHPPRSEQIRVFLRPLGPSILHKLASNPYLIRSGQIRPDQSCSLPLKSPSNMPSHSQNTSSSLPERSMGASSSSKQGRAHVHFRSVSPLPSDVPSSSAAPHLSPPPSLAARLSDDPEQALEFQAVRTLQEVVEQFRNEEINAMEAFRAIRDISSNDPVVSQDYVSQIMDIQRETNQFKRDKLKGKEAAVSADQTAVSHE